MPPREPKSHYDTPTKAMVQGTYRFLTSHNIQHKVGDIFREFGATLEDLIREGWANVSQEFINERVRSMPKRLQAVIDGEGAMTGF